MIIKNRLKFVRTLRSPIKHTLIVGASGSGKDFFGERFIAKHFDKGFKIIDFFSLERFEGMGYSIPLEDKKLIELGKSMTGGVFKPRAYPNKIYMINGNKLSRYPRLPKNIQIVSLKEEDLDTQDLIYLLGTTDSSQSFLFMIAFDLKDNESKDQMTLADVESYCMRLTNKEPELMERFKGSVPATAFVIRRNIALLRQSGIFANHFPNGDPIPKINIDEVMKEKSITTFGCSLLETDIERAVGLGILLKRLLAYNQNNQKKIPLFIYFREIQQIYNKNNRSFNFYNMLRQYVYFCLTEGRDNLISLICNAQTLSQVDPIRTFFNKVFALRLPYDEAKKLINYAPINKDTLNKLQMLDRGMGIYINNGIFEYVVHSLPPSFQKKQEGSDVLGVLGNIWGWNDYSDKLIKPKQEDNPDNGYNNPNDGDNSSSSEVFSEIFNDSSSNLPRINVEQNHNNSLSRTRFNNRDKSTEKEQPSETIRI